MRTSFMTIVAALLLSFGLVTGVGAQTDIVETETGTTVTAGDVSATANNDGTNSATAGDATAVDDDCTDTATAGDAVAVDEDEECEVVTVNPTPRPAVPAAPAAPKPAAPTNLPRTGIGSDAGTSAASMLLAVLGVAAMGAAGVAARVRKG
ncbi:MAG: hypothetical protein AVDCRST_MAG19-459 [uncultured Thermomicrobiales bacterium]|uniref:Gram-positive cocci surface proteins LPxTG domain-containing protein n=1 Tax=uncultured Thermomicrobiales bacterium TaxID=1645740 RepID=A0A6J4UFI2_9BACT|nr:MAG: hypothetical protein AVDCRST_MAG19-459 [uncultured Thermomicrobiales bacterium]